MLFFYFFFFKQKTAYEMRISDWSSDVCSSDLGLALGIALTGAGLAGFWVPQLVAIVTEAAGWRAAYLALAGIASATAPIVWFGFRSVPQGRKPRATAAPLAGMTAAEARRTGRFWLLTIISFAMAAGPGGVVLHP